ncbi:hypothetical protein K450DRAFT_264027 [Umbelopsis ramanniana AG]|uniref:Uncharacterized protein n=1 Tax=Umbelopsis ramanniana AG TaxID=1314678 RepID=A0AAD5E1T1_UMBRA|nr:uncharacterized protein K450DRAFT_264027 [Umbelopsis ramanniana AG]KAI8574940.1 hypothetical protein K450DRAFT_264027 [Umbelopsis ramanniana AG]
MHARKVPIHYQKKSQRSTALNIRRRIRLLQSWYSVGKCQEQVALDWRPSRSFHGRMIENSFENSFCLFCYGFLCGFGTIQLAFDIFLWEANTW